MASFEKMAKILLEEITKTSISVEKLAQNASLLRTITANQDSMIEQNKQVIELLQQLNTTLVPKK